MPGWLRLAFWIVDLGERAARLGKRGVDAIRRRRQGERREDPVGPPFRHPPEIEAARRRRERLED